MLTIRTDNEIDEMIAYLREHKVKFTPKLKQAISKELSVLCNDFKMKNKNISNIPDWLYD
jgi:hypothetical protein